MTKNKIDRKWLSLKEACLWTGLSVSTLRRAILKGALLASRTTGKRLVTKTSLDSWLETWNIMPEPFTQLPHWIWKEKIKPLAKLVLFAIYRWTAGFDRDTYKIADSTITEMTGIKSIDRYHDLLMFCQTARKIIPPSDSSWRAVFPKSCSTCATWTCWILRHWPSADND